MVIKFTKTVVPVKKHNFNAKRSVEKVVKKATKKSESKPNKDGMYLMRREREVETYGIRSLKTESKESPEAKESNA